MKTNVDKKKYTVYNDIGSNLHVAIKNDVVAKIEKAVRKYKHIEDVPDDDEHAVKGVYLENTAENEYNMINEVEAEVRIRNLRFDNL